MLQVTLYRPWSARSFPGRDAQIGKGRCGTRPDQGSGRAGRAALPRRRLRPSPMHVAAGKWPAMPKLIGGRYGLSSKDFDPAMAKAVFDELKKAQPKHGFTVGIIDDVSHTSLEYEPSFDIESPDVVRALFYGLGADGTVGANKNSVKILAADRGSARAGLLRLRLEEIRLVHDLASAFRAETRARAVSAQVGELRGRAQVRLPVQAGRARRGGARRRRAHQQSLRAGQGLGRAAAQGAAADHRQEAQAVRHRCIQGRVRPRARCAQQYDPADLLLRALGSAASRRGHRRDQERDRKDLRAQGHRSREKELRRHRQCARQPL